MDDFLLGTVFGFFSGIGAVIIFIKGLQPPKKNNVISLELWKNEKQKQKEKEDESKRGK